MKCQINKTAVITCENAYEIRIIQEALQAAITHGSFDHKELQHISDLERSLIQ